MALVKMKQLLLQAQKENRGCGAFSVGNMEMVKGAIRAAEELNTPIILQIAEVRLKHSPLHLMGPMMVQAAKEAKVDVAVHLDHGLTMPVVEKALELGFTSVMLDASTLPFEENMERVKQVVRLAAGYGATVEAELGLVGGSEDGSTDHGIRCTDPEDAASGGSPSCFRCAGRDPSESGHSSGTAWRKRDYGPGFPEGNFPGNPEGEYRHRQLQQPDGPCKGLFPVGRQT